VKGYQLPVSFRSRLLLAKLLALLAAYLYVFWLHFDPTIYGEPWLFWGSLPLLLALNALLFGLASGRPESQERMYLYSLGLDLCATVYICRDSPDLMLVMLVGLGIITGFYNFVLPRSTGIVVTMMNLVIYGALLTLAQENPENGFGELDVLANVCLGTGVLAAVAILVRRIKRSIDEIFAVTESLTLDLSMQVVDAEISVLQLVERNNEVRTLLDILSNMVSVLDWDELFKSIIAAFHKRFTFDKFSIYLFNADENVLELRVESGGDRATGAAVSVHPDKGVVGWCYTHGRSLLINDVKKDARYVEFNERGKRIRSLACQPLVFRAERLGVLCLDSERVNAFDEESFAFLEHIAPLISVAVSNSLSYTMVKEESHTDNLTGLANHRGFMEKFEPLLETTYVAESQLALLLMDIDHFKQINDTYGHLVGNIILQELAGILRGFFRSSDLVGRFGGEEFSVVLNGTSPDMASRIAEQLRRKVEQHQFPISLQRDAFKQVTISIGVATTHDSNLEPELARGSRGDEGDVYLKNTKSISEAIIHNADKAMYVAKEEGRNRVRLSPCFPVGHEKVNEIEIRDIKEVLGEVPADEERTNSAPEDKNENEGEGEHGDKPAA
jgi:diguanylate cyclase (GGDEF)-like protein